MEHKEGNNVNGGDIDDKHDSSDSDSLFDQIHMKMETGEMPN